MAARIGLNGDGWARLRWRIEGSAKLLIPPFAGARRVDELWRTTCFELFVREPDNAAYLEFNLSPSEAWAAYRFGGYRTRLHVLAVPRPPVTTPRRGRSTFILDATLRTESLPQPPFDYGLSAVLEEEGGVLSYWALCHPPAKPDFHDPACFAATLGPADHS